MTFRQLRRVNQALTEIECTEILNESTSCVLSLTDAEYPYSVPISFAFNDNHIYFHCAKVGHKIDCIRNNPKLSLCIIAQDDVQPQSFSTFYKSVIVFGTAHLINDFEEMKNALRLINHKYSKDYPLEGEKEIEKDFDYVQIIRIDIDHISGKKAKGI